MIDPSCEIHSEGADQAPVYLCSVQPFQYCLAHFQGRFFRVDKAERDFVFEEDDMSRKVGDGDGKGILSHIDADEITGTWVEAIDIGTASSGRFLLPKIGQVTFVQHFSYDAGYLGNTGSQFFGQVGQAEGHSFFAKAENGLLFRGIVTVDVVEESTHTCKNSYNQAFFQTLSVSEL